MRKKYSYKQKTYALGLLIPFVIIFSYKLSISKTIQTKRKSEVLLYEREKLKNAPEKLAYFKNQLEILNAELGNDSSINRKSIYKPLADYCLKNTLIIREIPKTHTSQDRDIIIETDIFLIEGSYVNLIKLIHSIGKKIKIGKVVSCRFYINQDRKHKLEILIAEIHVQNIRKSYKTTNQ